jgi:cytosine/adenosine deaminase-related metal-dependent hydrolase
MRSAYAFARLEDETFGVREALRAATVDSAAAAGLDDVGSLREGNHADLVLLRTDLLGVAPAHDPVGAVVLSMDTRSVDTVVVGGRVVKRDGRLLDTDWTKVLAELANSAARVVATA